MKQKGILTEAFMILVGTFIPSHVTVGSVSGFATVLVHFIPLRISVITFILNGALLIVGFIFIGRDFGVKTIITSLLLPVFMGVLEIVYPNNESIMGDPFLDMICYLFVVSIGQAILFQWNASSGGLDILGKIINKRVCIISEKEEEIADFILHQLHSGATFYEATGAYDNKSRREIITIVNKNEYSKLMSFISKEDPNAFVTIYAVNEVIYRPKV